MAGCIQVNAGELLTFEESNLDTHIGVSERSSAVTMEGSLGWKVNAARFPQRFVCLVSLVSKVAICTIAP